VYFVNAKGALAVVRAKGGEVTIVASDGVSSPVISPAGDMLAYVRGGKVEVLTFAAGTTAEFVVTPAATMVGWAKDKVVWAAADGVYAQGATKPTLLATLPTGGEVRVLSIATDGMHVVYRQDQKLFLLDLTTEKSTQLGQGNATFYGWSPSGTQLLYTSGERLVIADLQGNSVTTLAAGEATWSTQDAILVGGDSDLFQVRPDGTSVTKLANGTYHLPVWAPNGTAFAFFRGGALWTATAPPLPPQPTATDLAAKVLNSFMQARLNGQSNEAAIYLDANGKQAYSGGGLNLVITGDPQFKRFYILTQQVTGTQPDSARFVVRIVLAQGKLDVADFEETLTIIRDATTRQFLIDQATATARRDLGKGAAVVGVVVAPGSIQVTFDSDLDPGTVADSVLLLDARGRQVEGTSNYTNRTVTISGLELKPGAQYKLVVLPSVRDVLGHNVASEYDLQLLGPVVKNQTGIVVKPPVWVSPSPSPLPSPSS
jgi:hypothetical protein